MDNWINKSKGMICLTCMYFVEKKEQGEENKVYKPFGRCRRNAPTMSGFPVVFGDDWCGNHKLDSKRRNQ